MIAPKPLIYTGADPGFLLAGDDMTCETTMFTALSINSSTLSHVLL